MMKSATSSTTKLTIGRSLLHRCGLFLLLLAILISTSVYAQVADYSPQQLNEIDVVERLGESIPTDVQVTTSEGTQLSLEAVFGEEKPVVLVLAYYNCPMLCSLVLNGLTDAARAVDLKPGRDYTILTVSIEPTETPELAAAKKENYIKALATDGAADGWTFCVADSAEIARLAAALGFKYYWNDEQKQWAHPAVLHILTPDAVISRYLYGLSYKPTDFKLSLLEAARGNIGTTIDRIVLYCFHYDADAGGYVVFAGNVMRLGGIITVLILAAFLGILWVRYRVIASSKL